MTRIKSENKELYGQLFTLGLPIIIQNLLSAAVSSADVIMLNFVGQSSISAVSLAANYASVLFMFYYGIGTGATLLCAQYFGKKDFRAIHAVEGIALRFSLLSGIIFALAAFFVPELMMSAFTTDAELIEIGASYLRWMGIAYISWAVIEVYVSVLRSVDRVRISMFLNILAFSLNIVLNAVFIFGLFGAPKLGAAGVGLATALSRLIELLACVIVSVNSKDVKIVIKEIFESNKVLFGDFLNLAIPAMINDVSWGLAFSMYSVIMGHMSSDMVAANSIVVVVRNAATTFCFGIASAGGIMLGNIIGEGDMEKAKKAGHTLVIATIGAGILGGIVVAAASPFVLHMVSLSETAMGYLRFMLLINVYYIMGQAVNTTLIAGVFRAGGDTKFGMICDTIDMWCYSVPLGFLAAFVFKAPPMVVYFLLCTDEFVKWPWVIRRYRSRKWLNNITRDNLFEGGE
ncbi:MAG: MATE family efflux transporter [Lachnospiraceae bacterium]|nr:MATE family efflux transporter [Lachnospiraceae bacterium]